MKDLEKIVIPEMKIFLANAPQELKEEFTEYVKDMANDRSWCASVGIHSHAYNTIDLSVVAEKAFPDFYTAQVNFGKINL